jgi:restriction system protein
MLPILRMIAEGKATIADCVPSLIQEFQLTTEDVEAMLPSGKQTLLTNRAYWARLYLSQAGLVSAFKRGAYQLTPDGTALLSSKPLAISNETLRNYAKFQDFLARSSKKDGQGSIPGTLVPDETSADTPEIRIEKAHAQLDAALVQELLENVQSMHPTQFEQLIVDLLLAMGYGGGDRSMGERIGKSGDGGIDGIINEDALGLDAVYIQAKRYAPDSKVGRPALQAFVGSLTGEGANKGVFVTTSDFSKEAKDYLNKVQHRIVLINGDRLARLMIQHEVGVRARKTYVLRSVDEDYFTDF